MGDLIAADEQYKSTDHLAAGTWKAMLLDNTLVTASLYAAPGTYNITHLPESDASGTGRITLSLSRTWDVTNEVGRITNATSSITWTPGTTTAGTNPIKYVHIYRDDGTDASSEWGYFKNIGEWSDWGSTLPVNLSTDGSIFVTNDGHA